VSSPQCGSASCLPTTVTDFFQIKWQGKAHLHSTWENSGNLAAYRGIKRLDNYFRKMVQEDIHMKQDEDIPPEEHEKWNLDREREADALEDYKKVERVIGMREDDEGDVEYLVKCMVFIAESLPLADVL
jgi:chromodomain-helicase-DNA-binding protein 1